MPRGEHLKGKRQGKPFVKGDPRINRQGANRRLPLMKELMNQLLGHTNEEDLTQSEAALIVSALISTAKAKGLPTQVQAAKEILERAYGKVKDETQVTGNVAIEWKETKTYKSDGAKKARAKKRSE